MHNGITSEVEGIFTVTALKDGEGAILDFSEETFAYAAYTYYADKLGLEQLTRVEIPKEVWSEHILNDTYMFTIHQRPLAKSNLYRARAIGKRAIIYTTKEMEEYQIHIGEMVKKVIPKTLTGLHSIYVRCYSTRTKLYDIDNPLKAILDSTESTKKIKRGKQVIYICENSGVDNDKNYQLAIGERIFVDDKDEERIEVIITPYRGIMDLAKLIVLTYEGEELLDV